MSLNHTVHSIAYHSPWSPRGRFPFLPSTFLGRFLCLPSLLALVGSIAAAAGVHSPVSSKPPGPSFAIADFDGDLHPDLASVEVASANSRHAIYSIRLQLTAAGRQVIRVVAPSGGLQILARDVNGDHVVDLVLATATLGEPVAVLLNDGHGGFKQVDPSDFPGAFANSGAALTTDDDPLTGAADGPPLSRPGISTLSRLGLYPVAKTLYAAPRNPAFLPDTSLTCRPSRAPPHKAPLL